MASRFQRTRRLPVEHTRTVDVRPALDQDSRTDVTFLTPACLQVGSADSSLPDKAFIHTELAPPPDRGSLALQLLCCMDMKTVEDRGRGIREDLVTRNGQATLFTSIPKCGTHLLLNYFTAVGFEFGGPFGEIAWNDSFNQYVRALGENRYCAWHYHWTRELSAIVAQKNIRVVFLYRDPRAHVASNTHFILQTPSHPWHEYLTGEVQTIDDRLLRVIEGIPPEDVGRFFKGQSFREPDHPAAPRSSLPGGVNSVYGTFAPWLDEAQCLRIKFEDVIGPRGGGSADRQHETIRRLMEFTGKAHVGISPDTVADKLFDAGATTFRKGSIDSWREDFSARVHRAFMRESGRLLELFGYGP